MRNSFMFCVATSLSFTRSSSMCGNNLGPNRKASRVSAVPDRFSIRLHSRWARLQVKFHLKPPVRLMNDLNGNAAKFPGITEQQLKGTALAGVMIKSGKACTNQIAVVPVELLTILPPEMDRLAL